MSSRLNELARALPEEERKELYRKIVRSLSLDYGRTATRIYPAELQRSQRTELIRTDMARMSLSLRFRVWLRRLFTGKDRETCFVEARLATLRHTLRSAGLLRSDTAADTIEPSVAEWVFTLYRAAYPVIPLFGYLWSRKEALRLMVHRLLAAKIPDAKEKSEDLLPQGDMEDIFIRTQSKREIRTELLSRLDSYLESIPGEVYTRIAEGIMPLYYLRDVCLFDFAQFFGHFGYRPGLAPPEDTPNMRRASARAVLPLLEELYYGVFQGLKVNKRFSVHRELLADYAERNTEETGSAEAQNEREGIVDGLLEHLHELHETVRRLGRRVPLADLIRYHRRDPYYRVTAYAPQIDLRGFYANSMRIELLQDLDKRFPEIRRSALERLRREIFGGPITHLEFLPEYTPASVRSVGLPPIRGVQALNVLHAYLVGPYQHGLQEFARVLGRMIPARHKSVSRDLAMHTAALVDVAERIERLDKAFSPDTDMGKLFHRVRYSSEHEPQRLRSYRSLVEQTEREIGEIMEGGNEHIEGIRGVLAELSADPPEVLRERYALYDATNPHSDALKWRLAEEGAVLKKLSVLLSQSAFEDDAAE
ncbi:MAG: DUF5312 family protein [Spirochaetaceae bacterium]